MEVRQIYFLKKGKQFFMWINKKININQSLPKLDTRSYQYFEKNFFISHWTGDNAIGNVVKQKSAALPRADDSGQYCADVHCAVSNKKTKSFERVWIWISGCIYKIRRLSLTTIFLSSILASLHRILYQNYIGLELLIMSYYGWNHQ